MLSSAQFRPARSERLRAAPLTAGLLALLAALPAAADPLYFSSSAWAQGSIDASYASPLLGNVSFTLQGPYDSQYNWNNPLGPTSSGLASVNYAIAAGQSTTDPIYNIVTSEGQYGFSYAAQAEADGLRLRTKTVVATVDAAGEAANSPNSRLWSYASAQWNQQFLIEATPNRQKGSYGAILVGFTLDGLTSEMVGSYDGYAYGTGQLSSSFVDAAGVSFSSSFQISTDSWDQGWTGSRTVYKKLLFQYGTAFNINLSQWSQAYMNGESDFSHTGYISSIELPYQSALQSGAEQAGLGGTSEIYGTVSNSTTVDDINTNWDFGNGGGGFNPPVPEPSSYALMLAGLAAMGFLLRRRGTAPTK